MSPRIPRRAWRPAVLMIGDKEYEWHPDGTLYERRRRGQGVTRIRIRDRELIARVREAHRQRTDERLGIHSPPSTRRDP